MSLLRLSFSITLLSCFIAGLSGQSNSAATSAGGAPGYAITLASASLGETRTLNIYLPAGYDPDATDTYPVIYALDGSEDEDFPHLAGLLQFLHLYDLAPKSILVGIANVDRQRDFTYPSQDSLDQAYLPTQGGSAAFITFLREEVQPKIESQLRTNGHRSLIGQSLGGLLATEVLFKSPDLFDDYLIISPSLWWDQQQLIDAAPDYLAGKDWTGKRLFVSVGQEHPVMQSTAKKLADAAAGAGLEHHFAPLTGENHATILHTAISTGLRTLHRAAQPYTIAFGSCGHQNNPLPVFDQVVKHQPDAFIFLGDNIYGDTRVMDTLRAKYARLAAKPTFQRLKAQVPLFATWDDHDYGWNDSGRHYPFKEASKEIFLDFFEEPADSERRKHPGIYHNLEFERDGKQVQILLLDTRTFRDDIQQADPKAPKPGRYFYSLDYTPYTTSDSTLLGAAQWQWLDEQLAKPADLRIIASSTQFGIEYNGYEAWANFPHEQDRMLELIRKNRANGVIFISGDVHYGEISRLDAPDLYPIYDVTSSGLSSTWYFATPNRNRIEGPIMDNHFGLLTVDLAQQFPVVKMEIWDVSGNQRIEHSIPLSDLRFD